MKIRTIGIETWNPEPLAHARGSVKKVQVVL